MFIGRERELASLKEFYEKDGIGMTVIYGRRCREYQFQYNRSGF